jgi:hypothetical protein
MRPVANPIETAGFRGPINKHRSPAQHARDLQRAAKHNREQADVARLARDEAWSDGGRDEYLAERQNQKRTKLAAEKRVLRRSVYRDLPDLEGRPFRKGHAYRGDRS